MASIPIKDLAKDTDSALSFKKRVESLSETEFIDFHNDLLVSKRNIQKNASNKKVIINGDPTILRSSESPQIKGISPLAPRVSDQKENASKKDFALEQSAYKDGNYFRAVIQNYRIEKIKQKFLQKLQRNSIYRQPVIFQPFERPSKYTNDQLQGITLNKYVEDAVMTTNAIFILLFSIIFSLILAFPQLLDDKSINYFLVGGITWQAIDILLNFIRIIHIDGEKLTKVIDIGRKYKNNGFFIDFLCLAELIVSLCVKHEAIIYLNLLFFLKIPQFITKINLLEVRVFDTFYKEQYWGLLKLIFQNFLFAHFIGLLLILMAEFNEVDNWLITKNLDGAEWFERYVWAYYWGTTIMLTIGFGDFAAVNHHEALILIFIEMISCMALAYNINCVGNLISELRKRDIEKDNNLKILRHISQKNSINNDLDYKLKSFIEESYDAQIKLQHINEKQLVAKLPENLKQQLFCASNFDILRHLFMFRNLTIRTVQRIASKIQTAITHPGEILVENGPTPYCFILKQGSIGYFPNYRMNKANIMKIPIDLLTVKQKGSSKLISLEFLCPNLKRNYVIKSIGYSIIYHVDTQGLEEILKSKSVDYEYYFILKHKQRTQIDQFEVIPCEFCNQNIQHSKFRCPKLHYLPINQTVIHKHLNNLKTNKNKRQPYLRSRKNLIAPKLYKKNCQFQKQIKKQMTPISIANCISSFPQIESDLQGFPGSFSHNQLQKQLLYPGRPENKNSTMLYAAEQMKKQVENLFYKEETQDFWDVQSDCAYDYNYYFRKFNPSSLHALNHAKTRKIKKKKLKTNPVKFSLKLCGQ